jgi:hypothetical protein
MTYRAQCLELAQERLGRLERNPFLLSNIVLKGSMDYWE